MGKKEFDVDEVTVERRSPKQGIIRTSVRGFNLKVTVYDDFQAKCELIRNKRQNKLVCRDCNNIRQDPDFPEKVTID